jgi:hypothetical protein
LVFQKGSYYIAQADLQLVILQPPKYWDYRYEPPHLVCKVYCLIKVSVESRSGLQPTSKNALRSKAWWHMPIILALGRLRQGIVSWRPSWVV